ncbi:MAG: PrgI family protein [Spirochaetia bacterium]|nr:MAG: PrgI family protein [Spirochaetia bacterium]
MHFQIPQFIEIENKVVGPLTLKQFFYLAVAAAISFAFYFVLAFWLWIMITAVLVSTSLALAFIKYNGQPLPKIILYAFGFFWRPKFYLWQKTTGNQSFEVKRETLKDFFSGAPSIKKLWQDLMTTKNPIPKREKGLKFPNWGKKPQEKFQVFRKLTGEKEAARRIDYR